MTVIKGRFYLLERRFMQANYLRHGQFMSCSVSSGDVVEELTFNIRQQTGGSNPEELIVQPLISKLLFDEYQPGKCILSSSIKTLD